MTLFINNLSLFKVYHIFILDNFNEFLMLVIKIHKIHYNATSIINSKNFENIKIIIMSPLITKIFYFME